MVVRWQRPTRVQKVTVTHPGSLTSQTILPALRTTDTTIWKFPGSLDEFPSSSSRGRVSQAQPSCRVIFTSVEVNYHISGKAGKDIDFHLASPGRKTCF